MTLVLLFTFLHVVCGLVIRTSPYPLSSCMLSGLIILHLLLTLCVHTQHAFEHAHMSLCTMFWPTMSMRSSDGCISTKRDICPHVSVVLHCDGLIHSLVLLFHQVESASSQHLYFRTSKAGSCFVCFHVLLCTIQPQSKNAKLPTPQPEYCQSNDFFG
jgi:hypothetical protein